MKKSIFLFSLFLLIGVTGCDEEDVQAFDLSTFIIFKGNYSGFTDYSYIATIKENGKLNIEFKLGIENIQKEAVYQISDEDLLLIKEKLQHLLSIDLKDQYGFHENSPTDGVTTKVRYRTINKSDSTFYYYPKDGELPDELLEFNKLTNQIIEKTDTII